MNNYNEKTEIIDKDEVKETIITELEANHNY